MRADAVILILLAAFWESWRWLIQRTWPTPDESITLVVTIAIVTGSVALRLRDGGTLRPLPVLPFAAALVVYALAIASGAVPSIICAALAVTTTLAAIYVAGHHRAPPVAFWGLCCLVLPVVPTLQFYLGYPMRVVSAALTVPLLKLNGFAVSLEGTALVWRGEHIQFDAPCSGVTMAWAGMLLVFAVATVQDFDQRQLLRAVLAGLRLLLAANVLRAANLFYIEAGVLPIGGEALHQGIGLAAFGLALAGLIWQLRRQMRCVA